MGAVPAYGPSRQQALASRGLRRGVECLVVQDLPYRYFRAKGNGLEVLSRNTGQLKAGLSLKPEATVVTGVTEHDATDTAKALQFAKCGSH